MIDAVTDTAEIDLSFMTDEEMEEIRRQIEAEEAERKEKVARLGESLAMKRAEAIRGRSASGIEKKWDEDEEFYEGVDDSNRSDSGSWDSKPVGRVSVDSENTGSTIFINITGPYCDAAGASLADMLLPTDDVAFQVVNTPVPELMPIAEGNLPKAIKQSIRDDAMAAKPEGAPEEVEAFAQEAEGKMVEQAQSMLDEAKEKAEKAQQRIEDWHVECQYHAEVRRVIEDAAKIGSGVLKGPFPQKRRQVAYKEGQLIINEEIKPGSKRVHYRNIFPDPGAGESLHNGAYIFERDDITAKQLRELIGVEGYLEEEIRQVLEEGPSRATSEYKPSTDLTKRETKSLYEIWYFYGEIDKADMEAAGCECEEDAVPAQIVMVNNHVIKAAMNPLDSGDFPYDIMVWKKQEGSPWGVGVARLIRTAQRMVNGAARNLMDNAGMAGGPMWAYKQGVLSPIDGIAELVPRKGWIAAEDADIDDISRAFTYFKLDMMVNELTAIINLGMKLAEDVTGLPMIMQGQMGAQRLDTLGQTELLNNNANIVRRRIARLFDDLVTEPHTRRYYNYLLQYGEDEEKGEFVIDARGSSNLVERAIQKEKTMQWLQMAQNPVYGIDPKKVAKELLRADKFDPKLFEFDDEEWQQVVEKMAQPQQAPDPRTEIAQMNAQIAQMKQESAERMKQAELQSETERQNTDIKVRAAMQQAQNDFDMMLAQFEREGADKSLMDQLKVRLNETVMKLTTQKELSYAALGKGDTRTATPAVEPAGQAPDGRAYEL
jgi:hypothetical protein